MFLLFLYIFFSFLFSIEYAIVYEDILYDSANSVANLYSNQVNDDFKLESAIFAKSYISENYSGENMSNKLKSYIINEQDTRKKNNVL